MVTGATERHDMVTGATERHDMVTGATERHDMVTGATQRQDMVTGVQRERVCGNETVTGATEQIGNYHEMTGVHEEVTYCSPSTSSSGKKKNRSSSQRHFGSDNIPATIEADQFLLALQQLASNNNSAKFHNFF